MAARISDYAACRQTAKTGRLLSVQGIVASVVVRNPTELQPTEITQPLLGQSLSPMRAVRNVDGNEQAFAT